MPNQPFIHFYKTSKTKNKLDNDRIESALGLLPYHAILIQTI